MAGPALNAPHLVRGKRAVRALVFACAAALLFASCFWMEVHTPYCWSELEPKPAGFRYRVTLLGPLGYPQGGVSSCNGLDGLAVQESFVFTVTDRYTSIAPCLIAIAKLDELPSQTVTIGPERDLPRNSLGIGGKVEIYQEVTFSAPRACTGTWVAGLSPGREVRASTDAVPPDPDLPQGPPLERAFVPDEGQPGCQPCRDDWVTDVQRLP